MALHVGSPVFEYEPIDVMGITDLLNTANKHYLQSVSTISSHISDETIARAPGFVFHHIGATLDLVQMGSSTLTVVPTTNVEDCPELDFLVIGGPDPATFKLDPKLADLIRRHVKAGKILFTNCSGAAVVASTGVLDGKNATINNVALES